MIFTINKNLSVECEHYQTRYSWGHKAWLYRNGVEIGYTKYVYYNRTWESYEFESILRGLAEKIYKVKGLSLQEYNLFKKKIASNWKDESEAKVKSQFGAIGAIAMLGDMFGKTQKESNDWKARMLKAGLENKGFIMPEDWDTLSESDKETRLNAVINCL